ncbi:selenium-binding protein SBP56-related protein [Streptomyces sp. NPDC002520]
MGGPSCRGPRTGAASWTSSPTPTAPPSTPSCGASRPSVRCCAPSSPPCCAWDAQIYPAGIDPWMVKLDADTTHGGLAVDSRFFPHGSDFLGLRVHQTRLQGGDASSDSYCYRR